MSDIVGGLSGMVSTVFDRVISAIETVIDTFVSKVKTLWEENKPLAVGLVVASVAAVAIAIPFLPEIVGVVKGVFSVFAKIIQGVLSAIGNLAKRLLSGIGSRAAA